MRRILVLFTLLAAFTAQAQKIEKQTFVYAVKEADTLRLDRYVALSADSARKPCLLFVFGGGFVRGTRDKERYLSYFEHYANKGYVVVSIDYRLGLKKAMAAAPLDEQTFPQAWLTTLAMATGDLYDATAYVLRNADAWGVDKDLIVSSGSSAGAITVLMGEYGICNNHSMAREKLPQNFRYAGVIAYAGAIFDMQEEMRWAKNPAPIMLFHGDADRSVPYGRITYEGAGFFGSEHIAEVLTQRRVPHWFYSVANAGHGLAVTPMDDNREEIDSFLEKLVRKRQPLVIDSYVTPLDKPEVPKNFTLMDYIRANYGR
ncbi:carboxylesterase family protein [uncultured Alistipes sp.]|jgi:esterase/lipase|uniref:alpha/beta hydrolase n=1 Tax=uncultured Alistipes sp. TaxID=538949 RepID=UPI0025F882FE|nr:carboxylesterase family protein [uncultured Alistipes sp.]